MHKVEYKRPVGLGTTEVGTRQYFGRSTIEITITEWEPNRKLGMLHRLGGLKGKDVFLMEAVEGNKTRLTRSRRLSSEASGDFFSL